MSNEPILVSAVTVAYNSEATIRDTIEAVLNQTYEKVEYIIVDGASEDSTMEIVKSYEKAFEEKGYIYKYISEKDGGMYEAMNKGIAMATGNIVGIINSDDWYEKNAMEVAAKAYMEEPYDMFYADLRIVGENGSFIKVAKPMGKWVTSRKWNHPTTFITKDLYTKYSYRNKTIHDDWDLILRLYKAGIKVTVKNETLANFRRNGVSHEKSIKKAWGRVKIKYGIYKENGYSPLYFIEIFAMEFAKLVVK